MNDIHLNSVILQMRNDFYSINIKNITMITSFGKIQNVIENDTSAVLKWCKDYLTDIIYHDVIKKIMEIT